MGFTFPLARKGVATAKPYVNIAACNIAQDVKSCVTHSVMNKFTRQEKTGLLCLERRSSLKREASCARKRSPGTVQRNCEGAKKQKAEREGRGRNKKRRIHQKLKDVL